MLLLLLALAACGAHPAPPAAPALLGTCPEAAGEAPLTMAQALALPDEQPTRVLATLLAHAVPCPPCPPLAQCEACQPEYELYGDEAGAAWVTTGWFAPEPSLESLAAIPVGSRALLCGAFHPVHEPGASRVFRLSGLQPAP